VANHAGLKLQPLDYFQHQCWGSIECDEVVARNLLDFGLEDNIVFSADYPIAIFPRPERSRLAKPTALHTPS